ncbi:NAD(P)/FAD-dependent oxidoreductase [Hoyosella sp. YIM 151337]|uniref:flavin-containing monooxygenase n=1 Tax=Hoyosella sp. YIM 151337 TaxID=2992742 RepID=UPI00223544D0|nr:NAD(P)/FAD-dependent oxidoreductase [Hoyosella sp. YIM 151337]MCW4352621.1 NAD(P)/FAD-dependent oxidoreductase [Hoyosella sp. YIM 151337]
MVPDHEVLIVGAGFSGIGAAIKLDQAGFSDFVILEDGDGVGGAWHWNTYPGVAVDIPSFSYQFSFDTRPDWSRVYAPGRELKSYAESCVDKYGLRDRLRFNSRVESAVFDEASDCWVVGTTSGKQLTARYLVTATGVLTQPKPPAIDGIDSFGGTLMHTARWDHTVDLRGKKVAVIGTGASAVQVIPSIAPEVGHLVVFQRTPIWCLPKPDGPIPAPARFALGHVPGARQLARLASECFVELTFPIAAHFYGKVPISRAGEKVGLQFLRRQVHDPVVREKLTPKYPLGCKRPSFSNDYLSTFNRANVFLETNGIDRITADGIRTVDGAEHQVDVLILATGFKVFEAGNMPPFRMVGRGGRDLESWWDETRYQAYQGVSVPKFPNAFTVLGPYGYNGSSYFNLIEVQAQHIARCLTHARRSGATRVEITEQANARYLDKMMQRRDNQVFFQPGCATSNSYYFDKHGDVPFRPALTLETMWESRTFDLNDYAFAAARPRQ